MVFEGITLAGVTLSTVSGQGTRGFTLNGVVNPEGKAVSSCVFEYDTRPYAATSEAEHGTQVACSPASLGSGVGPVGVSAQVGGLEPGRTYYYRLVAENSGGRSATPGAQVVTGPVLGSEYAIDVASTSATVVAPVDPNGADTNYYVQYGPSSEYGSYAPVAAPGVDLGAGVESQPVSVHLQGLQAGTSYHYRFVAVQDGESFSVSDGVFRTQSVGVSSVLADGREWELVSPADKKGALLELFEEGGDVQAAADGGGVTYVTEGPHVGEDPQGDSTYSQVLSRRGAPGRWESQDLTLPDRLPETGESALKLSHFQLEYRLFSPDLTSAFVEPQSYGTPPLAPSETRERTLYLRDNATGKFLALVTPANSGGVSIDELTGTEEEWELHFLDATPDLKHVVFQTPLALTENAIDEEILGEVPNGEVQHNLYEWNEGGLGLINVLPGEEGVAHGRLSNDIPPVYLAGVSKANGFGRGGVQRDVSSDGRRVAWTWGSPYLYSGESEKYRGLYVRDMVEERTVKIGGPVAVYQTMNSEGSKIFYLEHGDLYVYEWETGVTTDLTADHGVGETSGNVQEVVSDVSEDGSYVYFVASGVLGDSADAVKGGNNLYLLHDGEEGWATSYIATLSPEDSQTWYYKGGGGGPRVGYVSSRVSPDGKFLAFMSERSLTGYDNTDAVSGQPDEEVFVYDADTNRLACTSCDPTGARPVGVFDTPQSELLVDREGIWTNGSSGPGDPHTNHWLAGSLPGWNNLDNDNSVYQPRYLSDSGRLFFDSPVGLVSQDTNGLEDAYEYEPMGVGSCVTGSVGYNERSDGCASLVSSGTSNSESVFYDASENGDDVFFTTTSKLVSEDYDKGYDVYDAHVCSGSMPCVAQPVPLPPCDSESCRGAPPAQPEIFGPAPSATFKGAGNLTSSPPAVKKTLKCAKGKKASHGKCVKTKPKRKRKGGKGSGKVKATHQGTKAVGIEVVHRPPSSVSQFATNKEK